MKHTRLNITKEMFLHSSYNSNTVAFLLLFLTNYISKVSSEGNGGEWHSTSLLNAALGGNFGRASFNMQSSCLKIPANMTLCHGIGYEKMRLPNLLDHETLDEAMEQSSSWLRLAQLDCHEKTRLFLCSLFAPVCYEKPIYPCKSLCQVVRDACEPKMLAFGYSWPDMVRCDQYPEDNDMCIRLQSTETSESAVCRACAQRKTKNNIMDNFCRADFVLKGRIRKSTGGVLRFRKVKVLRARGEIDSRELEKPIFRNADISECCEFIGHNRSLLLMGTKNSDGGLVPTLIVRWSRNIKKISKTMLEWDCGQEGDRESPKKRLKLKRRKQSTTPQP